jgi:DNA-directed RNA polymerase I, II, and III subunit RPABC3
MQLLLDVNTDIYPVELGDKLTVALAKSLTDNEMDDGIFDQSGRASLADEYEYVMYGKVFKCLEDKGSKVCVSSPAACASCVSCVCGCAHQACACA